MAILALILLCSIIGRSLSAPASVVDLDPYPGKPRITFRPDGTFKITVFSDLHFGENAWDTWGPRQDVDSTTLMNEVLSTDKPDYVVFNGDQITGENTFLENSTIYIDEVLAPVMEHRIPFSTIGGNHDNSQNVSHLAEIEREWLIASDLSYTRIAAPVIGDNLIHGPSNYWVPVYANEFALTPSLILWFFDSRDSNYVLQGNETQIEDWIEESIASWIISETAAMDATWGPAEERGTLVFMHIPPHDLQMMQETLPVNTTENPGLNADLLGTGSTQATNYPEDLGKDATVWNAINTYIKNIHAVTFGHDHGDSWCARDPAKDVVCCFAKHSGYGGYDYGWGHGVRNFLLRSANPNESVDTWIRMEDGTVLYNITLDSRYMR